MVFVVEGKKGFGHSWIRHQIERVQGPSSHE